MKTETYPLAIPPALLGEVRRTAEAAGLSLADTMRQSLKLGLPKLREQLATTTLQPFTPGESREAFAPDPEWDAVTASMSRLPLSGVEE